MAGQRRVLDRIHEAARGSAGRRFDDLRMLPCRKPDRPERWRRFLVSGMDAGSPISAMSAPTLRSTRGHVLTAQSNWLRAINYYQASTFALDAADTKRSDALRTMRDCARRYVAHLTPAGEVVEIPWLEGHALEGYFLPAPAASGRTPVVVCMGDPGHRKEEYLFKVARYARERGMSLLAVDLLGSGAGAEFDEVIGRPDLETVGRLRDGLPDDAGRC